MYNKYLTLLAMLICVVSAYAQSFEVDGLQYNVTKQANDTSSGEVEVTGGEIKEVIEIPENVTYNDAVYIVTSIGSRAFSGRYNSGNFTRKYIIPGTVRTIGNSAFYDNYYLEEVEFNEGLETIGQSAFGYAFQLKEIRIPNTVTAIERDAFITNQQNRATISCLAETPPAIQPTTFAGRTDATLHVVISGVEAYSDAEYWKDFADIVGDIIDINRCYAPKFSLDNDLLTISCETEGATIYYTTDGSIPDENAIRYTSPISFSTDQIIRAIAIAEGYENSAVRNFYDKDYVESITNVIDEQGIHYTLRTNDFGYSVTAHSEELSTEIVIPEGLNGLPVTTIGDHAFYNCSGLTSVTIPNSVTSIGGYAFYNCSGLTSVTIPNSVTSIGDYAFYNCSGLTSVTIPNSVTTIGSAAFSGCRGLTSITIPNNITFGDNVFSDCNVNEARVVVLDYSKFRNYIAGLYGTCQLIDTDGNEITEYIIPEGVKNIPNYAFNSCNGLNSISIPNSVTSIGDGAFSGCSGLTSVTIPNSVTSIGGHAFYSCSGLTSITIPNSVTTIGEWAFSYCKNLSSIILGNLLTTIEGRTFLGCTNLLSITIPNSVTNIGDWAFYECSGLSTVKMGKNVRSIGNLAFRGSSLASIKLPNTLESIGERAFNGCSLTSINIPGSVTTFGERAFDGCSNLSLVSFEDGLTTIGNYAFANCSLTAISIPNSVTHIGYWAFANNRRLSTAILGEGITKIEFSTFNGCSALSSVIIPDGVTSIGQCAFANCGSLASVKLPESLTSMDERVFENCSLKSIELPNAFTIIPENCFYYNNFQYIKLGNNVKSIGKNAFGSREPLLEIGTSTPPTIASDAFPKVELLADLNVIVPNAAAETAYRKAAVWQEMTFSNQGNISEVTVETPGDLSFELITQCNMMPAKVVGLKVNGTINANDFNQMLVNMKSLLRLDLSGCNITSIPDNALNGKTQLQELILPTGLQTIGKSAFQGCTYLTGELDLPTTLTTIGESAFVGTDYSSVKLPSTLKTIGDYAFNNVPIKQQLALPKNVTSVGAYAFAGTKIEALQIPDGVTSIGDYAFDGTPIQGHVTIPDGVTYLGKGAFRNSQLSTVFLPNSVTELSQGLFQGCQNLDLVYVPDNYTGLSSSAFDGCGALTILRLSANLATMGSYSFQNTPLEYLKVPAQVEVLSQGVLKNCKSLESLSLPASLKTVEAEALYGCTALRNLSVEAIEPPVIKDRSAIRGINTDLCLISIPTSSYRSYVLAEYWGQFVQMRNDIAVETSGNGEIAFESVVEEDESDEEAANMRPSARGRKRVEELASEEEESMTYVNNGSTVYVPQQGQVRFYIIPAEGEHIVSATLDGEDIMPYIVDGVYVATADKRNAKLVVVFSGDGQGGNAGLMGDVNGDGNVSVTDVGCVINYILEQTPNPFIVAAADMNGDEEISVTDVGYIINYILNDGTSYARAEQKAIYNYGEPMLMHDAKGYVLALDGADAFIAFQMDINVQEAADGCKVQLKNTGTDHRLACRQLADGRYRVVCYSPTNEIFRKGFTDLLTVASESNVTISNIRFTTEGLGEVRFDDAIATPTSIASVADAKTGDIKVYTLEGQLLRVARAGENPLKDLQPGIYLINDRKFIVR